MQLKAKVATIKKLKLLDAVSVCEAVIYLARIADKGRGREAALES